MDSARLLSSKTGSVGLTRTPPRQPGRTPSPDTLTTPGSRSLVRPRPPSSRRNSPSHSPIVHAALPPGVPPKTLYFIRHGQSLAQAAGRTVRLSDASLLDCGLSPLGVEQSRQIPLLMDANSVELVLCSPLTRALQDRVVFLLSGTSQSQTALIAFPNKPILVHYELREVGSTEVPENIPRDTAAVLADLLRDGFPVDRVDAGRLRPPRWPRRHDASPRVVRRDRIRSLLRGFVAARPERVVAVVAHHNVIQAALAVDFGGWGLADDSIRPRNAVPIPCCWDHAGLRVLAAEPTASLVRTPAAERAVLDRPTIDSHPLPAAMENSDDADTTTAATLIKPLALKSAFDSSAP